MVRWVTGKFPRKLFQVFLAYQLAIKEWCEAEPLLPNLLTFTNVDEILEKSWQCEV